MAPSRDDSHSLGPAFEGLPLWGKITLLFGFPTLVAMVLMAQDANLVPSLHRDIHREVKELRQDMNEHRKRQEELIRYLNNVLAVMCENQASTAQQAKNCTNLKY